MRSKKIKNQNKNNRGYKVVTITIALILVLTLTSDVFATPRVNSRVVSMPVTNERTILQVDAWEIEMLSERINFAQHGLDYYIDQHINSLIYHYPDMDLSIFMAHRDNIASIYREYVDEFNRVAAQMRARDFDYYLSQQMQSMISNYNVPFDEMMSWIYFIDADSYYNLLNLQYDVIKRIYEETRLFFITHHALLHYQDYGCVLYEYTETIEYIYPEEVVTDEVEEYIEKEEIETYTEYLDIEASDEELLYIEDEEEEEYEQVEEIVPERNVIVTSTCIEYGMVYYFSHSFDFLFEIMDIIHEVRIFDYDDFMFGMHFFSRDEAQRNAFDAVFDEVYRQLTHIESDPEIRRQMLIDIFFESTVNWRSDHINEFIPAYKNKRRSMLANFHQVGAIGDNWWWFHRGHRSWIDQDYRRRTLTYFDLPFWAPNFELDDWSWIGTILNDSGTEFLTREEIMDILENSTTGVHRIDYLFADDMLEIGCNGLFRE